MGSHKRFSWFVLKIAIFGALCRLCVHKQLVFLFVRLQKYVFPQYPDLGERIFRKMHKLAKAKTKHLGVTAFRQQCEMYLSVLDDALIHEHYVKMFFANGCNATTKENATGGQQPLSDEELLLINTNGLTDLLLTCFRIGVTNYIASAGKSDVGCTTISADTFCPHVNLKNTHTHRCNHCSYLGI